MECEMQETGTGEALEIIPPASGHTRGAPGQEEVVRYRELINTFPWLDFDSHDPDQVTHTGRWKIDEKLRFEYAINIFSGERCKYLLVAYYVNTRSVSQCKSHGQKMKLD